MADALCDLGVTSDQLCQLHMDDRCLYWMGVSTTVASLMGLTGLRRGNRHERAAFQLYGAAVAAAREPFLYETLGVPDTLDGRFDLISLHAFLLIHRLNRMPPPGPALAQAVFDAMFSDMDINLREMGVGDLSVGRRVRAMWEAFHGRAKVYTAALDAADVPALETALARNVWRGEVPAAGAAASLARLVLAQVACLTEQAPTNLIAGEVWFRAAAEVAL